ncbi:MAG: Heterodisulfide reductase subunit A-like protein [Candidatus Methanofastidiosum methylothiophilum]|uniref:Heterodisulfide reductase subunit A-like protein n=1 Tax=Candidatus Methanofastidiosum methylothiophilum TaxID=1705564 RepID=A0A150IWJ1_9EURY|nr:MAG: Heterodisulfide reductase subunit A-like protein [Candidatus Methanofastidiosum methylthiophilus]
MKQIAIVSGKGGTGKSSLALAFSSLAKNAVIADCDVDASNLHIVLNPTLLKTEEFIGSQLAQVDKNKCTNCMQCYLGCKFSAITKEIEIKESLCEGCGVCRLLCSDKAITMKDKVSGYTYISETRFGLLSHAFLKPGAESSGKLVNEVRKNAIEISIKNNKELILIDGPPGIGCPLISTITGINLAIVVTEPTFSAIHDLERVFEVNKHFGVKSVVCINKSDINSFNTSKIKEYCDLNDIVVIGELPYDPIVNSAIVSRKTLLEISDSSLSSKIIEIWKKILEEING